MNRLLTKDEFLTSIKWAMVEVILNNPEYEKGSFSNELEELADSVNKATEQNRITPISQ